ncbi:Bax inhibitor-1/YccA family protein [Candidatus Cyrtobacter comes]|uniref:Bax inhibitor-1/YccA family protein n=1 Tax=Candidatus Cyrtobacter comes TaxID=675776 RepID=A0ABU5L6V4_9RICK|nr:Bax inhibitor-1/YccA family protein [Candidatus Cyrtobacter comes]MDZ5761856.1 Bax inhibitor-1/YccA family protein [Candidatus Cyrtobacter comes]
MDYTKFKTSAGVMAQGDTGLRSYMVSVFRNMSSALAVTAVVALLVSSSAALMSAIFDTKLLWLVIFAPLGMSIYMGVNITSMSVSTARFCLYIYSALMGLSLSSVFLYYTGESIVRVFAITSVVFGAMSLYGSSTKRDLSSIASFLYMGVFGVIVASLVNLFLQNGSVEFVISVLCVIIFTVMTAYDVQRLKDMYVNFGDSGESDVAQKIAVYGALSLYMNFINIFISLLRLFGERK